LPSPEERPDIYDYYDFRLDAAQFSDAYRDAVIPDHVKKAIAKRGVGKGG